METINTNNDMPEFIDLILDNNGAMVSTVEKMRMGVPPGGMSPIEDMESGGASYFFTRIKKNPESYADPGLYFKKNLLRRMDAISYDGDKYGRVTDTFVSDSRAESISGWKACAHNGRNETIFKYSVTLLDNIEYIVVRDAEDRIRVINSFKKHGIKKLSDGRNVEDVVSTPQTWSERKR